MFKRHLLLIILLLLSLVLMLGGDGARMAKARFLSQTVYYPFIGALQTVRSIQQARIQNRLLHQENARLHMRAIDLENRLLTLSGMDIDYLPPARRLVVADVIGFTGGFQQRQLIINRGARDGVLINSAVLNSDGAVGKVVAVAPRHSTVLPIGHPQFRLGVADARTSVQGVLETRDGETLMTMIPIDAEVALGDSVITSNLSTIFPKGAPVGVVKKLERHPLHPYLQARLALAVDVATLEQVTVLLDVETESDSLSATDY